CKIRLAHGPPLWLVRAAPLASRTHGSLRGGHALLPGAQLAAVDVGVVHRVSLCVEPERRWEFFGACGGVPCNYFRGAGRPVCETLWRTAQRSVRPVFWHGWIRRLCVCDTWVDAAGGDSVYCALGNCRTCGAVTDGAARGSFLSGKAARGDQFAARG